MLEGTVMSKKDKKPMKLFLMFHNENKISNGSGDDYEGPVLLKATSKEEILFKIREEKVASPDDFDEDGNPKVEYDEDAEGKITIKGTGWRSEEVREDFIKSVRIEEATMEKLMEYIDEEGCTLVKGWDV